jgi:Fe-S-cluster-containing dehydrogenase component/DMSO reductase anchor subunit
MSCGLSENRPACDSAEKDRMGFERIVLEHTRTFIDQLLEEQHRLTSVERFALHHERHTLPAQMKLYREMLPARAPSEGEQFAFDVDLDACSGCKACVTACHNLNGLDEDETWRSVGLLHGGAEEDPFQQTVTTACHHCLEPACLEGCPVLAYEKDPRTGIVRHLDDQCIGCQYCILKCPYDVPKYSRKRGIVRKCDMCVSRLEVGEAPACAQACPNRAIRITIVNQKAIQADAREGLFLPGTPDPDYTKPTTRYRTRRQLPSNLLPADAHALRPGHSHPSLVAMLVLTQLSVGAFCLDIFLRALFPTNLMLRLLAIHSVVALAVGLLALGTSTLHLGRPLAAWRAVIGLRTSWLSREIVAFGLFAGLAMLDAARFWLKPLFGIPSTTIGIAVAATGVLGVFCSMMIYRDTHRAFWRGLPVALKFYGTTALLGTAAVLFVTTLQGLLVPSVARQGAYQELTVFLSKLLGVISLIKLGFEAFIFRHLRVDGHVALRSTARLLTGELAEITTARILLGIIGGVLLPIAFVAQRPAPGIATLGVTVWILLFLLGAELLERYLFFTAAVPDRMPGGIQT